MTDETLRFYNANAEAYAGDKKSPDPRLFAFLARCKPGGRILELGTGGGVDAAAIIGEGFDLDATDGSAELAAIATRQLGRPVRTMLFEELDAVAAYDGIYACASLTHVARTELADIIAKIHRALVDGGVVWASFKTGDGEATDAFERRYNFLPPEDLMSLWRSAAPWSELSQDQWLGSAYDRKSTEWLAVTAVK
ncbi:class I SAM-dependent methyltransferase [Oryzifoliimicrobium ureilyticus]|uniref:class I SAM-dependent methyltransferase n=1 Tax=Oryzifoliimicrobium ureilyticus TaxID=3113724 RepID=UPI00307671BB